MPHRAAVRGRPHLRALVVGELSGVAVLEREEGEAEEVGRAEGEVRWPVCRESLFRERRGRVG